jgi:hypothetical protein
MGGKLGKMAGRPQAFAQRLAPEPGDHPDDIHGGRREEVLEGRACQAKIPTPAEINASDPWRETALHSRPQGILGDERRRLLALPRALECLVVGLQPGRELARGASRRGARLAGGARATRGSVKPDTNHGVTRDIMAKARYNILYPRAHGSRPCRRRRCLPSVRDD